MSRLVLPLLVGLLALAPGRTAGGDGGLPTPDEIDVALERGVAWVLKSRSARGTWGSGSREVGHTALAVFALLHAGVDSHDRVLVPASRAIRAALRRHQVAATYDAALLTLIARDAPNLVSPQAWDGLVRDLERAQAANGQWSYRTRESAPPAVGDNSNTQFAVLALGASVGAGREVDVDVLRRAWRWWRTSARPDGGHGYASGGSPASQSTGSMTAAGIASLSILEAALSGRSPDVGEDEAPASRTVEAALERLARDFRVDRNFGPAQGRVAERQRAAGRGWVHYYLWSVERALVLAGRERLGDRDWYALGARHLLDTQTKDGSWRGEHPLYATCFALLFLSRAADPPRVFTPRSRAEVTPGDGPGEPSPATPLDLAALEDDPVDLEALAAAALARPPAELAVFVQALDDRRAEVRRAAAAILRSLLGDDVVGRADRHPLARGRLALWLRRNARDLEPRDGRFVLPPRGA